MEIELKRMTREMCRELYSGWENDEAIYMDMSLFRPYVYTQEKADAYFDKRQEPSRVLLAITLDDRVIGEVQLKNIDRDRKECELSIHLQCDAYKGRGYGTRAERLAVSYAFDVLGMNAVNADTVLKNTRSAHVLEKAGFRFLRQEGIFRYYRIEKNAREGAEK